MVSYFHGLKKCLKNIKLLTNLYLFYSEIYIKHELMDHISSQHRIFLILKICIHALLDGTHPLQVSTGQLIEMVCSVKYPVINLNLKTSAKEKLRPAIEMFSYTLLKVT